MTALPLRPCPHREIIPGPLATVDDLAAWAAALAAEPCPECAAPPSPEPPPLPELPDDVAAVLRVDGRAGALRAQRYLDERGIADDLLPAVADTLAHQPGTGPYWRRWWATWRGGVLLQHEPRAAGATAARQRTTPRPLRAEASCALSASLA